MSSPASTDPSPRELVPWEEIDSNIVETSGTYPVKRHKRLTSPVWNDFEKVKKNGVDVAICKCCKKELTGSSTSGTTHLKNHLLRCPGKHNVDIHQQCSDIRKWVVPSEKKKNENCVFNDSQYDENKSRMELVRMIIFHDYPFSIVEQVGFRRFVHSLCPSFNMISHDAVESDCVTFYEKEKKRIYDVLEKLSCRLSFSMDLWNSCQNVGYICLTVHYVDDDWKFQKKIISFMQVGERYTGDVLADVLKANIVDWNVNHKLFAVTLKNDGANEVASREIKDYLCQSKLLLNDGKFFHVQCVAHIINLLVQDGLEKVHDAIENIRESIKFVKSSPQHQQLFDEVVQQLSLNTQKGLCLDVPTWWNSTYFMLQVALEYRDAFFQFRIREPKYTKLPSDEQWEQASALCKCLKVFNDVTKLLLGKEYPTANHFFEEFCEIHLQIVEWCNSFDELISSMATMMKEKFDKYWNNCSMILAVASFLDPRYKMKLLECYYPQIYVSGADDRIKEVLDTIKNLYNEYAFELASNSLASIHASATKSDCSGGVSVDSREKLRRFDRFLQENTQNQRIKSDLDQFLDEGVIRRDKENFNVLNWWKVHATDYPVLSKMARDVLGIPISTVTSDLAFHFGGRVLDAYRSSLNAETVQALICAQDWLKDELGGLASSVTNAVCLSVMDMSTSSPTQTFVDMD